MGWGVVESDVNKFPPGTVNLVKKPDGNILDTIESLADQIGVKKRGNVILQPQPSDDPNDPLNWSQSLKIAHVSVLAFLSAAAGVVPVMIQPGLTILADQFQVSPDTVSSLAIGSLAFWTAVASFVVVSAAVVWGKRPLYVTSALVLTIANLVAFKADNFGLLVAMRTITGLASAPGFSLLTATIADIFFVHERGFYIAIWNICLGSGGQIGQVICGFIIEDLGVPAVFGFAAIVFALLMVASYFLALESTYDRPDPKSIDYNSKDGLDFDEEEDLKAPKAPEVKKPYFQQLALWNGRLSNQSFWLGVVKPFGLIVFPAVAYGVLAFTVSFSFLVGVPIVTSVVFAQPPYNLTPSQIGLTNLPLVAVSIIGGLSTGWFANVAGNYMARTNGSQPGVLEPEFRLVLLAISGPTTTAGLIGTGIALDQALPLAWVLVWMSVFSFGTLFNVQVILTYVVDCFPEQSGQAFSTINLVSSLVIFVGSGVLITWYEMVGPMVVFGCLAAASVITLVTAIPVYVFGKRMRAYMAGLLWTHKLLY